MIKGSKNDGDLRLFIILLIYIIIHVIEIYIYIVTTKEIIELQDHETVFNSKMLGAGLFLNFDLLYQSDQTGW